MSNLVETVQWETGIYQIEVTDPVLGGPTGISNKQGILLGNRTAFLYARLKDAGLNYAVDTGTLNALVVNVPAAPLAWVDGAEYRFKPAFSNTTAATFTANNVGGALTPVQMYAGDGAALQGGEMVAGGSYTGRFVQALNSGAGGIIIIAGAGGIRRAATPASGDISTAIATMAAVFTAADGRAAVSVASGANVTLTSAQAGNAMLNLTGTPSAAINLIFPARTGQWIVSNNQGGAFAITALTSAGGSTGVVLEIGVTAVIYSDGTNIAFAASGNALLKSGGTMSGPLAVQAATLSTQPMQLGQATGRLLNVQRLIGAGTYTPTAGTTSYIVDGVGAGGAGGGTISTGGIAVVAAGGGSAGTWGFKRVTSGIAPVAYSTGSGGAGVAGGTGGAGGSTTFGALMTLPGGGGGTVGGVQAAAGVGGTTTGSGSATGADVSALGMAGNQGFALSSTSGLSGFGGTSKYGSGGLPAGSNGTGIINGNPASGGGAGGGGAVASNSALQATGGNGSNGVLIVYEYS